MYFLWLLAEGRHLVAVRSRYLDLAYFVWLQCRFELWRPMEVILCSRSWMEKQILLEFVLPWSYLCCVLLVCTGREGNCVFRKVKGKLRRNQISRIYINFIIKMGRAAQFLDHAFHIRPMKIWLSFEYLTDLEGIVLIIVHYHK